jgi:bisphosphoglycerate-dependent phosphoglycerate mutase family 1
MNRLTDSPVFISLIAVAASLPFFLFTIPAGIVADKIDRKTLLGVVNEERIIVPAHGNTLRALIKYLDQISDGRIPALEVPTGIPLVYELDDNLAPRARYYLGDSATAREAQKELES